ncbi:hypothetical protein DM01DRAFT_1346530 [Hesseltinella vesiculosa]|uniref:Uncharacterized protein n=1 Tax=Hesseltinella vesiculosa TaxID=101127 RepID=A0A1X2GG14_9FUNG|nr:hypothetical protein DM01DRAFT_1346530 [Hesseltinella vesiculosa]
MLGGLNGRAQKHAKFRPKKILEDVEVVETDVSNEAMVGMRRRRPRDDDEGLPVKRRNVIELSEEGADNEQEGAGFDDESSEEEDRNGRSRRYQESRDMGRTAR